MAFPSPAQDYEQSPLIIDDFIGYTPSASFGHKVETDLPAFGLRRGDILVIDQSEPFFSGAKTALTIYEGQYKVVQIYKLQGETIVRLPNGTNKQLRDIEDIEILGIAVGVVRSLACGYSPLDL